MSRLLELSRAFCAHLAVVLTTVVVKTTIGPLVVSMAVVTASHDDRSPSLAHDLLFREKEVEDMTAQISKELTVDVHCDECGGFTIGADVIAESQRLLTEGCPGSPYECPPSLLADLLPQLAVDSSEPALRNVEGSETKRARTVSLTHRPPANATSNADAPTIARWEDDGGGIPTETRNPKR